MSKYRLTIWPALEATANETAKEFYYETADQMVAAKDTAADLLLFMQDDLKVFPAYSNIFEMEVLIDGNWEEFED